MGGLCSVIAALFRISPNTYKLNCLKLDLFDKCSLKLVRNYYGIQLFLYITLFHSKLTFVAKGLEYQLSLRKRAYSNILKILQPKKENFQKEKF